MTQRLILALTTEANQQSAETLARMLLEQRLAACVALQPQRAMYWWQGQIESSDEVQLLIKARLEQRDALETAVRQHHSYETPEFLCWAAEASGDYATWVAAACRP
ncbi:divalent-cation tolerance protein CutA [Synechococcus sp. W4D4]|uniref:divalent-cation tolerance protein CutA n=1 Tax=Synechococcus sp. W4D4 TaxID=3392294 RepID=UPI0039EA223D